MSLQQVDLTNCDREPIHTPGHIQPHGAMIVCDPDTGLITHVSENAGAFLGLRDTPLIGMSLGTAIGADSAHQLRNAAARAGGSQTAGALRARVLESLNSPVDIAIHQHGDLQFVELETSLPPIGNATDPMDMTQSVVRRIGLETSIPEIVNTAAKSVKAMLGYDRVMVYRFLHNGAGEVIAEAKSASQTSFMGQRFPASDIPVQARRLYLENWVRMIGDIDYVPVALLPSSGDEVSPIDMSHAHLRSVSPIHCIYLRNIGVAASMSISIVVDGKLWGLVACHHDTPKRIPLPQRLGAELLGQYLSLQVAGAERRDELVNASLTRERLDAIIMSFDPDRSVSEVMIGQLDQLKELLPCDGVGIFIDGRWAASGTVPQPQDTAQLIAFLNDVAHATRWSSHELSAHPAAGANFGQDVAGLLAVPLSSLGGEYLIFFRSEEAHNVEWAGEPKKVTVDTPFGERLTPRGSFETWREEVRGQSKPWTTADLVVADSIRSYIRDVVLRYGETTAEERSQQDKRRRMLNDELNHRVKNIIALVKSIALQTGANARSVEDYSTSMEGRLRALAFAHDQSLSGAGGELMTLMEAEASLHRYGADADRVTASGPPLGLSDKSFGVVALLMHEMMTNAAKYGSLSTGGGRLDISWSLNAAGDCEILWRESGGPPVKAPLRAGFGSKLIHSSIKYDLGGEVVIEFPPSGLTGKFRIPARHLTEVPTAVTVPGAKPVSRRPDVLRDLKILLVEDQALIAMDTEQALMTLGASEVRCFPDAQNAAAALAAADIDAAVLDFNLEIGTAAEVADLLIEKAIPFVFATGYGDSVTIPERFTGIPVVRKPINIHDLGEKLFLAFPVPPSGALSSETEATGDRS